MRVRFFTEEELIKLGKIYKYRNNIFTSSENPVSCVSVRNFNSWVEEDMLGKTYKVKKYFPENHAITLLNHPYGWEHFYWDLYEIIPDYDTSMEIE